MNESSSRYRFGGVDFVGPLQETLNDNELVHLVLANYRLIVAAGWEERDTEIVAATHIMAYLLGAVEPGGEWKIIPYLDTTNASRKRRSIWLGLRRLCRPSYWYAPWALSIITPLTTRQAMASCRISHSKLPGS